MKEFWKAFAIVYVAMACFAVNAATNVEWSLNILRSGTVRATVTAGSLAEVTALCEARARTMTESARASHVCQTPRGTVTYVTDPTPVPVNCVVSAPVVTTSAWSACAGGSQARTVTSTRTVVTPPANGGTSCPALVTTTQETQMCTVTPPVEPPPTGNGTPLSMLPNSYPVWIGGGARHETLLGLAWDGSPVARITPPTSEQSYAGIGQFLNPATTSLAMRFEMRGGANWTTSGQSFDDNKFIIVQSQNGNRPMLNFQSAGSGCLQLAIAQGTVKQFNQATSTPIYWRGSGGEVVLWCDAPRTIAGKTVISAGQWFTISVHISCETTLHASGHIRAAVWTRSGKVADWWIPYNYDAPARCTALNLPQIGGYYNGRGNGSAESWFDLAGVTIASGPMLTPRAGFLN
jgi:hypothetical protein